MPFTHSRSKPTFPSGESMTHLLRSVIELPPLLRVRRIHGLEHATINLLSQRMPGVPMAGHSDPGGFWLLGEIPLEAVRATVAEALDRLQKGDRRLAIAPMCGTNIVTIGTLAGLAGAFAMWGSGKRLRDRLDRLSLAISLATLSVFVALPLGVMLQEQVTTSGEPGPLQVEDVVRTTRGGMTAYRVTVRG
jgi:hypothetical protein